MDNINPEYRKNLKKYKHISLDYQALDGKEMLTRSQSFFDQMDRRRSVRYFSSNKVDIEIIKNIIKTASTAPSGAHKQPWTFVVVQDKALKKKIREAAEDEEKKSYGGRMTEEWLRDLAPLGTTWEKPFLETAPYLIVVFKQLYGFMDGVRSKHYYVNESVGISVGLLIAAIHNAGLVTLTHTPSPMKFLGRLLDRPENESAFVLLPVGYPADNCMVPDISRKSIDDVIILK